MACRMQPIQPALRADIPSSTAVYARTTAAVAERATTAKCLVRKNSSVFKMQSSCEAPCCSTRSWNQSPGVTQHKFSTDERWKKSLEAFIEFRTLFLSFIGFSNRIDRSKTKISKEPPKCDSISQESSTSQLGGSIGVAKFAKSSSKSLWNSECMMAWERSATSSPFAKFWTRRNQFDFELQIIVS